jgi:hypothetical protein
MYSLNFRELADKLIDVDDLEGLASLYQIKEFISEDFEILYNSDYEILEEVVRTLVTLDLEYSFLSYDGRAVFILDFEPPEAVIDLIKFFAYLTSSDELAPYSSEEFNYFLDKLAEINNLRSYYKEVVVQSTYESNFIG